MKPTHDTQARGRDESRPYADILNDTEHGFGHGLSVGAQFIAPSCLNAII